ncbi:hypothetical protein [uncultured Ruegeria sp.]|uniref:hypothetical protein n=1 Tax=uncultured Ruegeria sp. TaxID=259304 RepID=UPI0026171CD5|nr:hypothetical protein [uncultured Ruegeria sp.]
MNRQTHPARKQQAEFIVGIGEFFYRAFGGRAIRFLLNSGACLPHREIHKYYI